MTDVALPEAPSGARDVDRPLIVFYNLNLTTGREVTSMLRRVCGKDHFVSLDSHATYQEQRPFNRAFFQTLRAKEPALKGVSGHRIVPDIHLDGDANVFPIVFLRHPLLHAAATYEMARNRKTDWPGKDLIARLDMTGWIEWCLQPEQKSACKNTQSHVLSLDNEGRVLAPRGQFGIHDSPGFHGRLTELTETEKAKLAVRRGRLLLVQERLDAMPVVGIAELMQKSLFLLSKAAKMRGISLAGPTAAEQKERADWRRTLRDVERSLPAETLNRFYDANEDDLALWERYLTKLIWAEPVSFVRGKVRDDSEAAALKNPRRRKNRRPREPIPGLDEQL